MPEPAVIAQGVVSGLLLGGVYALIALGLTLIFGVTRIINFAHGELLMISMYAVYFLFSLSGLNPYLGILIVAPLLFGIGAAVERAIIHPLLDAPAVMQIFATVGLSIALQNLALMAFSGDYQSIQVPLASVTVRVGPVTASVGQLMAFLLSLVCTLAFAMYLRRASYGRAIRAVAQDRYAARLMGINVRRIYLVTFGIGSALVGVAGAVLMPLYFVFPGVGTVFVLIAFVVVVLGGMGDMVGTFAAGLVLGVIESVAGLFMPTQLKEALFFVIFLGMLWLKPSGLFGQAGAEEMGLK